MKNLRRERLESILKLPQHTDSTLGTTTAKATAVAVPMADILILAMVN